MVDYLRIKSWVVNEEGQGLTEYALVLVMVVGLAVGVLGLIGPDLQTLYQDVAGWVGAVQVG